VSALANQTAAIVGASSGIGLATAKAAALLGASVIMLSRSQARLEEAAREVKGTVRTVAMNMLDPGSVERAITSVGPIHHLVLAAAGNELACRGRIADLSSEQIERSFDKLRGYPNVMRAAAGLVRERGSVTLLSGTSALKPSQGFSVLAAANASVVSFGKAVVSELAPIRVNVVMPDVVDTPRHTVNREMIQARAQSMPARHLGQAGDIAHGIVFLMTNPYMTGHTLVMDGGITGD
jgi:NAD(P)-dependent dehydrogenase (short-subunit alcohol dehydrogenase family)